MTREPPQQVLGDKHVGLLTLGWGGQAEEVVKGRINFWSVVLCNLNTTLCSALLMLFYRKHCAPLYKLAEGCLSDKHNQVTVCRDWSVEEK